MEFLVDSNILLRHVEPMHPMHSEAVNAVAALLNAGESIYVIPKNISEFWNVCTRPLNKNGLGLSPAQTDTELKHIETLLTVLLDNALIYPEWRQLVVKHAVSGVQVHDARIVAAMKAHGIKHLVTFNDNDLKRYTEIIVMTPEDVINAFPLPATP